MTEIKSCSRNGWYENTLNSFAARASARSMEKICNVRQFGLYLKNIGYEDIYIFPESSIIWNRSNFVPYIFTKNEISSIFIVFAASFWAVVIWRAQASKLKPAKK